MCNVCYVGDDTDSLELLSCSQLDLVRAYCTGEEALKHLPQIEPDVVLMAIELPGMSGIECLAALRNLSPPFASRVLMLTQQEEDDLIFAALKAGADGYLLKRDTSGEELKSAILQVQAGGGSMSPSVARKVIAHFQSPPSQPAPVPARGAALSARQKQVLVLLNEGLMYKEIAERLEVSMNTVRKHTQGIYGKLDVRSRSDPVLRWVSREH